MATDETIPSVGRVVGENLRRLREERGLTQDEAVGRAVWAGLPWTRARLASLETGRRDDLTVTELLLLGLAFDVSPDYWFGGKGRMLVGHLLPSRGVVRQLLGGRKLSATDAAGDDRILISERDQKRAEATAEEWWKAVGSITETDANAARALGVSPERVRALASHLWGRSLIDEREARMAGEPLDAARRPARRGHITRVLLRELELAAKKEGNDGPG